MSNCVCRFLSYIYIFVIVHSFLDSITSNVGRIHDVNDVFSQIRLPSPILPSFISYYRYIVCLVLITTYLALGWCNRCFEHTLTMKDGPMKGFLSLYVCTSVCHEILKDYESLILFCIIKISTTFSRTIFLYSHLSSILQYIHTYIHSLYEYTLHLLYLYILYIYICIQTDLFILSDSSTLDRRV